jgi:PIN domain nuclease of toxin-antitoxin system
LSNLLLDICGLLWLSQGGGDLKSETVELINNSKLVFISSITAWEVSLLSEKNRIKLPLPPEEWFSSIIETQDIQVINISPSIAFTSNNLTWHHSDPADRFIIATAIEKNLTVVSKDRLFKKYDIEVLE